MSLKNFRKDIVINVLNLQGQVAISYKLFRAWVSDYQALPDLDAGSMNTVGIQSITLQHEGWQRDAGGRRAGGDLMQLPGRDRLRGGRAASDFAFTPVDRRARRTALAEACGRRTCRRARDGGAGRGARRRSAARRPRRRDRGAVWRSATVSS